MARRVHTGAQDCGRGENNMNYRQHRARQRCIETDGGNIAYVDEGQGPAILLLHGFPTSSWLFRNVIPILVENGFRVIAPDLLGFGSSAKPDDHALYSTEKQTRRIFILSYPIDPYPHRASQLEAYHVQVRIEHIHQPSPTGSLRLHDQPCQQCSVAKRYPVRGMDIRWPAWCRLNL